MRAPLARVDRRGVATVSVGHLAVDFAQGAVPALLVFLKTRFDLSYVEVAVVVLAATLSSSIAQPLFGLWSDRRGGFWLLPGGIATAGVALALATLMPSYPLLLAFVFLSATGVGAFHPEGAKYAGYASRGRLAMGVSLFSLGGNVGLALGPLAASGLVLAFGLHGGVLLALPGLVVATVLVRERGHLASLEPRRGSGVPVAAPTERGALVLLLTLVGLRSVTFFGLITFVPLWEVAHGSSRGYATLLLTLFLAGGAVGTIVAGRLADRLGSRRVLFIGSAIAGPGVLFYVLVGGPAGVAALIATGAATIGTFGITTSMSQQYMPGRVAMASGLSMGLSIGLGGVAAVFLGAVADAVGLQAALLISAAGAVIAAPLAFGLPAPRSARRGSGSLHGDYGSAEAVERVEEALPGRFGRRAVAAEPSAQPGRTD